MTIHEVDVWVQAMHGKHGWRRIQRSREFKEVSTAKPCPKCGSPSGARCITTTGKSRGLHRERNELSLRPYATMLMEQARAVEAERARISTASDIPTPSQVTAIIERLDRIECVLRDLTGEVQP